MTKPASSATDVRQRCVLRHRGTVRPFASVGLVCQEHLAEMRDMLANVAELHAELPYVLHPLAVAGERTTDAKRSKQPYPAAPANLVALALDDPRTKALGSVRVNTDRNGPRLESNGADVPDVAEVLADWCRQVATDRGGPEPAGGVPGRIAFLRQNVSWIVAQEWLREFEREMRACQRALAAAVGDDPMPPPFAECPYDGSLLWRDRDRQVIKLRREGKDPAEAKGRVDRVRCTSCGAVWEGRHGLARLVNIIRDEQGRREQQA